MYELCGGTSNYILHLSVSRQYGEVPEQDNAALELHGFHAQLHDRVQGALRRVDRQEADFLYFVYSIANIFNSWVLAALPVCAPNIDFQF
jgi:hypothetical protein